VIISINNISWPVRSGKTADPFDFFEKTGNLDV
jgi:hypothetical protein